MEIEAPQNTLTISEVTSHLQITGSNMVVQFLEMSIRDSYVPSTIRIYNQMGQQVQQKQLTKKNVQIDVTHLSKGVYYAKINGQVQLIKFLKI